MEKLVILNLGEGNFDQGFPVLLQIKQENAYLVQIKGRLPADTEILKYFHSWQEAFERRVTTGIFSRGFKNVQAKTFSCKESADDLYRYFNAWLKSPDEGWQNIRDGLQLHLSPDDEIRVILQTSNPQLRRLPWCVWELFGEDRLNAEIALSLTQFTALKRLSSKSSKVRILAVLGESTIEEGQANTEFDQQQLQQLYQRGADVKILEQPTSQELRRSLWEEDGWDIFFFAGHSCSQENGTIGSIQLNENENLEISGFQEALLINYG